MELPAELKSGLAGSADIVVGTRDTAPHVGSGKIGVLATPIMVNLMEAAALQAVERFMPAGYQTVGTHLDVRHFAATPVGLRVRAVTQNREMAAAMGIPTKRVDLGTFGLGSGIAGLGGVALSQLGNVGPELGQGYIVDSFMVVVLGGVGKIVGTIAGALGLGIVNKLLEPAAGAVLGKIIILGLIILFIQKRPQGIFALKGRAAEAG